MHSALGIMAGSYTINNADFVQRTESAAAEH